MTLAGSFNLSEKYLSNWIISPIFGVNNGKHSKNVEETTIQMMVEKSPVMYFSKNVQL